MKKINKEGEFCLLARESAFPQPSRGKQLLSNTVGMFFTLRFNREKNEASAAPPAAHPKPRGRRLWARLIHPVLVQSSQAVGRDGGAGVSFGCGEPQWPGTSWCVVAPACAKPTGVCQTHTCSVSQKADAAV